MKNSVLILAILVSFFYSSTQAQDFKLNSASVNLGKSSISSGYDICLDFKNDRQEVFSVIGNHTRMYATYTWSMAPVMLTASAGFNKNTPWIGPKVVFNPFSFLSTMHWYAISAGVPENPGLRVRTMLVFNAVYVRVSNFKFSYSLLHWLDESPQHIPGAYYGNEIGDKWSYSIGMEYNLRNSEPLFQFGMKKTF